jgi:hypothetical protein
MSKLKIATITALLVALLAMPLMTANAAVVEHESSYAVTTTTTYQPVNYWEHRGYYGHRYYRPDYDDYRVYGYYGPRPYYYGPYYRPGFSINLPFVSFGLY